jgi:hypothetical protein
LEVDLGELGYDLGEPEVSKVQPNDISYPVMKKAIQDSHEKFVQWQISECQMTAQLDSYSLNDKACDTAVRHAKASW